MQNTQIDNNHTCLFSRPAGQQIFLSDPATAAHLSKNIFDWEVSKPGCHLCTLHGYVLEITDQKTHTCRAGWEGPIFFK